MKHLLFLFLFLFIGFVAIAQDDEIEEPPMIEELEEREEPEEVFEIFSVHEKARFIGGDSALRKHILQNVRYPQMAKESGVEGTVVLQFVIQKDSSISDITVRSTRKLGFGLEEEAIRVMKTTQGKWVCAKQRDKPVGMRMYYPIRFILAH